MPAALPRAAYLPVNRCNLPARILGALEFQRAPAPLVLDGVEEFHGQLFRRHLALDDPGARAARFMDYLDVAFRLHRPEELGYEPGGPEKRLRATCFQMIRGWAFDPGGLEAAVLRGWVESRFGLLPTWHAGRLDDRAGPAFARYLAQRAAGIFGTAALEEQLDLLYAFCQHELARRDLGPLHLYRGVTELSELDVLQRLGGERCVLLLNNLSSFTADRERAEEFGHLILAAEIPPPKILFHNRLIPHLLTGEDEYLVLGGLYEVRCTLY